MRRQSHLIEALETRRLLSAAIQIHDGTLIVNGSRRADEIVVSEHEASGGTSAENLGSLFVRINGRERRLDGSKIKRVRVQAGGGDDHAEMSDDPFFTGLRRTQVVIEQTRPATIVGGAGNDTLIGGEAADSISGGDGADLLAGAIGNDTVDGDAGNDTIAGNSGDDLLHGGNGHDRVMADDAGDVVLGGRGFDLLLSPHNAPKTRSDLEAVSAAATFRELPEFGYANGVLTISGTRRPDEISFGSAFFPQGTFRFGVNDRGVGGIAVAMIRKVVVLGGAGDDSVVGGAESFNGGMTPEHVDFTIPMEVHGDSGDDTIIGGWGDDSLSGGEGADEVAGAPGNDAIDGGPGNDTLRGNDGDDTLRGRKGEDSLDGGDGSDHVNGGMGNDAVWGSGGVDYFEWPADGPTETKDIDGSDVTSPSPGFYFDD